ncbi:myrosinase 1-like [Aricia agestis]|uniref:myrosinase 1-like n=1 Tax=Aricia agestis TaxID=91739 RepID=UPI001C202278|nr:myrosinase 1-like [Aricia agestis]
MNPTGVALLLLVHTVASLEFPAGFKFGVATASYQVEGAWNVGGRTPSIWDEFSHKQPHRIYDGSSGDVACDSYHLWKRDIEMMKELGVHFYRFSISWNRLFPNGFTNKVSADGVRYYNTLIDALIANDIEPVVTLFHFDLPQKFQDLGGWTNSMISDWFADYARASYSLFADRVKTWLTINEPLVVCDAVYHTGLYAPGILSPGIGSYMCIKNLLVAHARAWRIYDEEFKPKYHGRVAICNHHLWFEPADSSMQKETELARQLLVGLYAHPIYSKTGGWPPTVEQLVANKSLSEGYRKSRLPAFTPQEIELIKGTYDFYGFNYYTSRLVAKPAPGEEIKPWPLLGCTEINVVLRVKPDWMPSSAWWLNVYPPGLRRQLKWFKDQYGDVEILITENGYAALETGFQDEERVDYYRRHLDQLLLSINDDKVNITGYTAWSLMDNYEWYCGYTAKFGLYAVDFNSPQRTRTPRLSAHYYRAVIQHNSLNFTHYHTAQSRAVICDTSILTMIVTISLWIINRV